VRYLLDIDAVLALARAEQEIVAMLRPTPASDRFISPATLADVLLAADDARTIADRDAVMVAHNLHLLGTNADVTRRYADLRRLASRRQWTVEDRHLWVASHALAYDCTVLSNQLIWNEVDLVATDTWEARPDAPALGFVRPPRSKDDL
jgi:predicted nucleic acid-binding protein